MNATLTETKEQEHNRLLTELHGAEQSYAMARRLQKWAAAHSYAEDAARITRLLMLNDKELEK